MRDASAVGALSHIRRDGYLVGTTAAVTGHVWGPRGGRCSNRSQDGILYLETEHPEQALMDIYRLV
eukprot:scaffold195913_cov28-Tisochrysis_lutea.AAC.5